MSARCKTKQMNWKLYLVDWIGVSSIRATQVMAIVWAFFALATYQEWNGARGWTDYLIPLSWFTGLVFALALAARRHELSDRFE